GSGFVAEVPLLVATLDKQGGRAELPGSVLHLRFAALPAAKAVARFRTSLKLRRIDQRLVFPVPDAQSGVVLTTDLEVHPPSRSGARARRSGRDRTGGGGQAPGGPRLLLLEVAVHVENELDGAERAGLHGDAA